MHACEVFSCCWICHNLFYLLFLLELLPFGGVWCRYIVNPMCLCAPVFEIQSGYHCSAFTSTVDTIFPRSRMLSHCFSLFSPPDTMGCVLCGAVWRLLVFPLLYHFGVNKNNDRNAVAQQNDYDLPSRVFRAVWYMGQRHRTPVDDELLLLLWSLWIDGYD